MLRLFPLEAAMITPDYARLMARYNRWQNESLYGCADRLSDADRKQDRGAFFGSIHGTLCHLVFGDQAWLYRFTGDARVRSTAATMADTTTLIPAWSDLKAKRLWLDQYLIDWATGLTEADLAGALTYHSVASGKTHTKSRAALVAHMFNHQTHHRGQVHCLLTQAGQTPDDTDIPIILEPLTPA
jgi:uncharacterized damage-inducible protein DinB